MKVIKKFLHIVFWGLLITGVVIIIALSERKHNETEISSFELIVENYSAGSLTDEAELTAQIIAATDTLVGQRLGEIKPFVIYKVLDRNPYVKYADIKTDIDGRLKVAVRLRDAIVRVINSKGLSYYIDEEGWIMPVNAGFPSRVPVINGYIKDGINQADKYKFHVDSLPKNNMSVKIYELAKYMNEHEFLNRMIGQVYITPQAELEIIPSFSEHLTIRRKNLKSCWPIIMKGPEKPGGSDTVPSTLDTRIK
jgi:cell division protein FtsQ